MFEWSWFIELLNLVFIDCCQVLGNVWQVCVVFFGDDKVMGYIVGFKCYIIKIFDFDWVINQFVIIFSLVGVELIGICVCVG